MRRIVNKPYKTHFCIDEAVRKDDGIYLITAVNMHGMVNFVNCVIFITGQG